ATSVVSVSDSAWPSSVVAGTSEKPRFIAHPATEEAARPIRASTSTTAASTVSVTRQARSGPGEGDRRRAGSSGREARPCGGVAGAVWLSSQVLGLEIAQHGHDATVLAVDRGKIELGEQGGDVLLHTPGGDEQGVGDRLVRAPLRHQREHLPLARGEGLQRAAAP